MSLANPEILPRFNPGRLRFQPMALADYVLFASRTPPPPHPDFLP